LYTPAVVYLDVLRNIFINQARKYKMISHSMAKSSCMRSDNCPRFSAALSSCSIMAEWRGRWFMRQKVQGVHVEREGMQAWQGKMW